MSNDASLRGAIRDARTNLRTLVKSDAILEALYNLDKAIARFEHPDNKPDAVFYCVEASKALDEYEKVYKREQHGGLPRAKAEPVGIARKAIADMEGEWSG